ncbi:polysaccharide synthase [Marssonina coronariae]|uniref:Polysaccharide synthase n=1 Tax=Diplocarpon coronariae TaxID=2795749 RepID=A0A218YXU1_9HELO|nr:polysaccharide synthase [Marssonina coronariae]
MVEEIHSSIVLLSAMCPGDWPTTTSASTTLLSTSLHLSRTIRLSPPRTFLAFFNDSFEIIICTTQEYFDEVSKAVAEAGLSATDIDRFTTMTAGQGARNQLLAGITVAKGTIIATSDNHIEWAPTYLTHMLACFAEPTVGAAAPQIKVKLSEERKAMVGPWEVAATKLADRGPGSATVMHVAATSCWILAGTMRRARLAHFSTGDDGGMNGVSTSSTKDLKLSMEELDS